METKIIHLSDRDRQQIVEHEVRQMAQLLSELIPHATFDGRELKRMETIRDNLERLHRVCDGKMKQYVSPAVKNFYGKWKEII